MSTVWDFISDQNRQIIDGLNAINNSLQIISQQIKEKDDKMLKLIASAGLPGFPHSTEQKTVGMTSVLLWRNESQVIQRIRIENLDVGQDLTVGPGNNVTVTNGFTVNIRTWQDHTLSPGQEIWGIVAVATIQVAVGRVKDAYADLTSR